MDPSQTVGLDSFPINPAVKIFLTDTWNFFVDTHKYVTHFFDPAYSVPYLGTGIKLVLAGFSMFFIFIIAYSFVRLIEIRKKEHEHLHHEILEYAEKHSKIDKEKHEKGIVSENKRWEAVLEYLFSTSEGDWKLAIIEADSMLEELMDQLGFKGQGLGEKLKSADQAKFKDLPLAWEAHIVRNKIAHEGSDFGLSQHEAKRVIAIYEEIFRDFGFI